MGALLRRRKSIGLNSASILCAALFLAAGMEPGHTATPVFVETVVDLDVAGDVKAIGNIDADGRPDLVVGGSIGEDLAWYRNPDWHRTVIAVPQVEFTTDGEVGDVDADGDLDIVVYDGPDGVNLLWFENPGPAGDPEDGPAWRRHPIGAAGSWGKDVELADFDGDGRLDVAGRTSTEAFVFFQEPGRSWQRVALPVASLGSEGLASGNIDDDDWIDLVVSGAWLHNPGGSGARSPDAWVEHTIAPGYGQFKAAVADLDGDDVTDVVFSASENLADVVWWKAGSMDPKGHWTRHVVLPALDRAHTLRPADMDGDGDVDLVLAQMHSSEERRILVLENRNSLGTEWRIHLVATGGLHNGVVADIDGDGRIDIFGANWTGAPPVRLWLNRTGEMDRREPVTDHLSLPRLQERN
jgi:hypothetical protein